MFRVKDCDLADVTTGFMNMGEGDTETTPQVITGSVGIMTTCKEVASDIRGFIPNARITMAALEVLQYVIPSLQCNPATTAIGVVSILLNKEEKLSRRLFFATVFIMASQLTLLSGIGFAQPIFMAISAYRHAGLIAKIAAALAGVEVAKKAVPAIVKLAQSYLSQSASPAPAIAAAGEKWASEFAGKENPSTSQNAHSICDGLLGNVEEAAKTWAEEYDPGEFASAFDSKGRYCEERNGLKAADALEDLYAQVSQTSSKLPEGADWAGEFDPKSGIAIPKLSPQELAQQWGGEYGNFNAPEGLLTVFPKEFDQAWSEAGGLQKESKLLGTVATVIGVGALATLAYQNREEIKQVATAVLNYASDVFGEGSDNLV